MALEIATPLNLCTRAAERLLIDTDDTERKLMTYRLTFTDAAGTPLTLVGVKDVHSGPHHDPWTDTTTLFTRILQGEVKQEDDLCAKIFAAGIIRIHMLDFLAELTTFQVHGPDATARFGALARFGEMFLGKLWSVYASRILPVAPF